MHFIRITILTSKSVSQLDNAMKDEMILKIRFQCIEIREYIKVKHNIETRKFVSNFFFGKIRFRCLLLISW